MMILMTLFGIVLVYSGGACAASTRYADTATLLIAGLLASGLGGILLGVVGMQAQIWTP